LVAWEVDMTEKALIAIAIAIAIAGILVRFIEVLPSLVWVFRCPADSPNFTPPLILWTRFWRRR
jgi:hypothetical protein